jgi:hypothetical protein
MGNIELVYFHMSHVSRKDMPLTDMTLVILMRVFQYPFIWLCTTHPSYNLFVSLLYKLFMHLSTW